MHTQNTRKNSRGRLSRETMSKLGKTLEAYYDDVRRQGVPDQFKELLQQLDDRRTVGNETERQNHIESNDKESH